MQNTTINHKEQIGRLNAYVLTRIAASPIHGVGLFAIQDIKKGQKLFMDIMPVVFNLPYKKFGKLNEGIGELLLSQWPQIVNGSVFAYPTTRLQAYLNHSSEANYDAVNDVALREILIGEEITEDYTKIPNSHIVFPWLVK